MSKKPGILTEEQLREKYKPFLAVEAASSSTETAKAGRKSPKSKKPKSKKKNNCNLYDISPEKYQAIKDMFSIYDKDGDGKISYHELMGTIQRIGVKLSHKEVEEMLKEIDADGNGFIEFKEFVQFAKIYFCQRDPEKELRQAFQVFDKNNDGELDASELKSIMFSLGEKLSDDEVRRMINEADADGDGKINIDEFVKMLMKFLN